MTSRSRRRCEVFRPRRVRAWRVCSRSRWVRWPCRHGLIVRHLLDVVDADVFSEDGLGVLVCGLDGCSGEADEAGTGRASLMCRAYPSRKSYWLDGPRLR